MGCRGGLGGCVQKMGMEIRSSGIPTRFMLILWEAFSITENSSDPIYERMDASCSLNISDISTT
jgi:hypothetical protein